jgi:predicted ester cyclase
VLKGIPAHRLSITSGYIDTLIENADERLKDYVPEKVYNYISQNRLFGYGKNKHS